MATETRKVLGQNSPTAAVLTTLYIVPPATQTVVSSLYVANSSGPAHFYFSIGIGGAADAISQYFYYNVTIPAFETFAATVGVTMGPGDELRVLSTDSSALIFSAYGVEIS